MEQQKERKNEEQDSKQNTAADQNQEQHQDEKKKGGIHNNALYAASMGRPATAAVDPHSDSSLAQTGTNVSYEGATGMGGAGSVGTGYTSGQSGTGASTVDRADYDQGGVSRTNEEGENNEDEEKDII